MMMHVELLTLEELMDMYFHGFRLTINDGLINKIRQEKDDEVNKILQFPTRETHC